MKYLTAVLILFIIVSCSSIVMRKEAPRSPPNLISLGLPNVGPVVYLKPIIYPQRAIKEKQQGWAVVQFDLDKSGVPFNIKAIDSSPKGYFGEAAVTAMKGTRFNPFRVDGKVVTAKGAVYRFYFKIAPDN